MSMPFTIDRATPADAEALAPLFDAYRVFYKAPSDPAAALAFLRERFERRDSVLFVARIVNDAVGFAQLFPKVSTASMRRDFILNDLFVHTEHRRMGVARALMHACADHARREGALKLSLKTHRTNEPAQHLYESEGWVRDDEFLTYVLRLDR